MKLLCFAMIVWLFLATGCGREPVTRTALVMDTVASLRADDGEARAAVEESAALLSRLDGLAGTGEESDPARLAAAGSGAWVEISPEVTEMLALAQTWSAKTDGAFDVTTGPLVRLWGIGTDAEKVPSDAEIAAAQEKVGWQKLELDEKNHRARLMESGMSIDLGGIAKGYALDEIRKIYARHGVKNGLVSLGGSSILALGQNEKGEDWRVGVRDPRGGTAQDFCGVVPLRDAALGSSGDYERYFEQDGVRYCHILDPRTGAPARSGVMGVTIVASGEHAGALSDLLSTTLFVLGEQEGRALLARESLPAAALFVDGHRLSGAASGGMPPMQEILRDVQPDFSFGQ